MTIFWSYGGGWQTIAIAVLIKQGHLPMPDLIGIADTSREVDATKLYLDNIIRPAGFDVTVIPHSLATVDLYREDELLIPAFTRRNGKIGQMSTFCSTEWKQRVCRRWLREKGVTDCEAWLGISTNEMHRMKDSGLAWYRHKYPLIETVPMNRAQCGGLVEAFGWPEPPKSRCWNCPMMSTHDWQQLKADEPHNFQKAVEMDNDIRVHDRDVYLHRSGLPLTQAIEQSEMQPELFDGCDSGYCMV